MTYVVSDLHGEYDLFMQLINKIKFSSQDEMFICGDVIDKGPASIKLAKYISKTPNIHCIIGNHEHAFLKYYHSLLQETDIDYDTVLSKLQNCFPGEDDCLDWEVMDWLETLPYYIEEPEFICVHAGIPVTNDHTFIPLQNVSEEEFVFDRRFKDPFVYHTGKCVFFGHTQTDCVCSESKILGYLRDHNNSPKTIRDYFKIHLDTGTWSNGVLGCLCIDTLKAIYVTKRKEMRT